MAARGHETERLKCDTCGGLRNHVVNYSYKDDWTDEETGEQGYHTYMVARCAGCDSIRFAIKSLSTMDGGPYDYEDESVQVYPDNSTVERRPDAFSLFDLPEKVEQMYQEARLALAAGALTLCGVGLRAIVEALCRDQGLNGNLGRMIDELVTKGVLAKAQADLLHEERYLGNAAVHEMERPTRSDLDDGFGIVEGLLKTLYVLPAHADRLRKRRQARAAATSAAPPSPAATSAMSTPAGAASLVVASPVVASPVVASPEGTEPTAPGS